MTSNIVNELLIVVLLRVVECHLLLSLIYELTSKILLIKFISSLLSDHIGF